MPERRAATNEVTSALLGEAQAALWLSESLILALLDANLLDTDTILEAIDIVIAAKKAKAAENGDPQADRIAITHLATISASIVAAKAGDTNKTEAGARARQKRST